MKLYTEAEIISVYEKAELCHLRMESFMELLTPIELPSDDEIEQEIKNEYPLTGHVGIDARNHLRKVGYSQGAKWLRDKIQGGSHE